MLETKIKHPQVNSKIFTNFKVQWSFKIKTTCFLFFVFNFCLWKCTFKLFYGEHTLHLYLEKIKMNVKWKLWNCTEHKITQQRVTWMFVFKYVQPKTYHVVLVVKKEPTCKCGLDLRDMSLGRSPEGGHGNALQYSCLENLMEREAWRAAVHRVSQSRHNWSDLACMHTCAHTHASPTNYLYQGWHSMCYVLYKTD